MEHKDQDFKLRDEFLRKKAQQVIQERYKVGLDGLVGGLECIIINTEPDNQKAAVQELMNFTSLTATEIYTDSEQRICVLKTRNGADFLIKSRITEVNPFRNFNIAPKSLHLPNTRLETFVFKTHDIDKYFSIQKKRGVKFLTQEVVKTRNYSFIQTSPSRYTGNSIGLIQWKKGCNEYFTDHSKPLNWKFDTSSSFDTVKELDHSATRVRAEDREAAILEFMNLTNYNFSMAIYVKSFNSITNVARLSDSEYAMVFTSGISSYKNDQESGPTEKFINNYGTRVHHIAFRTENIDNTFGKLKSAGMTFLIELVGSSDEGLKQTFSDMSSNTLLVNEYIHRYGDFDGFFTKSNVTLLTSATDKQ